MIEMKHTPGPWEWSETGRLFYSDRKAMSSHTVLMIVDRIWQPNDADARLIAAAPDLLSALIEILGPLNVCSDNPNVADDIVLPIDMTMGELRKARAALARATGDA